MRQSSRLLATSPPRLPRHLLLAGLLVIPACGGTTGPARYEGMTAPEKARELTKLRREAEDQLALFDQSGGADLEALESYVERHRETTQIFPADCPLCFAYYGAALTRLGLYYSTLAGKLEEERDRVPPDERAEFDAKIKHYRELMSQQFQLSNRQFEVYFRSEQIDSKTYYWVFRQYDALKDYRNALKYLDLYVAHGNLGPDDQKNAAELRRRYDDLIRREEERELEQELRREEPSSKKASGSRARAEPAN